MRDPVVAELILPRFLAPGDEAQGALNIDNVEGPPGAYTVTVGRHAARRRSSAQPRRFKLDAWPTANGARSRSRAAPLGVGQITLRLEGPARLHAGRAHLRHPVARAVPADHGGGDRSRKRAGASWRAPADALARFQPSAQALISFSNLAGIDPAPLLDALYRYPYGCSEQLTSVAMPLLYYNTLAAEADRTADPRIHAARAGSGDAIAWIGKAPDGAVRPLAVRAMATPRRGSAPTSTDFLQRAQRAGYAVPRAPMKQAYAALRRVARLNDFGCGGLRVRGLSLAGLERHRPSCCVRARRLMRSTCWRRRARPTSARCATSTTRA